MDDNKIVRSFSDIWRQNRKVYSIGGINFDHPVSFRAIGYYFVLVIICQATLGFLPGIVTWFAIPGLSAWYMDQYMIDNKSPYQFFRSVILHYYTVLVMGRYVNRFKYFKIVQPKIIATITYRVTRALK